MKGADLVDLLAPGSLFAGATAEELDVVGARASTCAFHSWWPAASPL